MTTCAWAYICQIHTSRIITAKQIRAIMRTFPGKRTEPRLLCYQMCRDARPDYFKREHLHILPIKNGTYLLTKYDIYQDLYYDMSAPVAYNKCTESAVLKLGDSEMCHIDNLHYAGVFADIIEPIKFGPIFGGRHRSGTFQIQLNNPCEVSGVQFEIDACYETENYIIIIEGKSSPKKITSFNMRQLYYPYKFLQQRCSKPIIGLFIHQLKNINYIWMYEFNDDVFELILTEQYKIILQ